MAATLQVVVFDFDETLAVDSGFPRSNVMRLFGGNQRIAELRQLLSDLAGAGIVLAVLSYNSKETFEPLLRRAGLLSSFDPSLLFGYEVFEASGELHQLLGPEGAASWDKGTAMHHVILPRVLRNGVNVNSVDGAGHVHEDRPAAGTVEASRDGLNTVLFCDDDPANILDVRSACAACATLYVPRDNKMQNGLQRVHMNAIRACAGLELASPLEPVPSGEEGAHFPKEEASHSPEPPPLRCKRSGRQVFDQRVGSTTVGTPRRVWDSPSSSEQV